MFFISSNERKILNIDVDQYKTPKITDMGYDSSQTSVNMIIVYADSLFPYT